jgi:hypothetical protein
MILPSNDPRLVYLGPIMFVIVVASIRESHNLSNLHSSSSSPLISGESVVASVLFSILLKSPPISKFVLGSLSVNSSHNSFRSWAVLGAYMETTVNFTALLSIVAQAALPP